MPAPTTSVNTYFTGCMSSRMSRVVFTRHCLVTQGDFGRIYTAMTGGVL